MIPFAQHGEPIGVEGSIHREGSLLRLQFKVADPERRVLDSFQVGADGLQRADELWKTTCFEAFFGVPGSAQYWELNVSGAKPLWNLYRFDEYRKPQPPMMNNDFDLIERSVGERSMNLVLSGAFAAKLEVSLTAVIRTSLATHYYALKHAGEKPDFHLRESFIVSL